MPLPPGIQDARPGGTHTSSPDGASDLSQHVLSGNRLHTAGTNVIPAMNCFGSPSALDLVSLANIEALDHSFCEQSP